MWLNSFMSWIGGKKALRELIVTLFPVYYERYIEVFGGGGWVLFHKPPGNDFEVYNDFNSLLVNLYRCVRDKPQELMESLRYVLNAREDFDAVRAALARDSPASDVQKAAWFYQLIRYSYASGLTSFGSQPHDMRSNFPLIEQAHRRLAKVVIENKDFEKLIRQYDRPASLFYLDPPYPAWSGSTTQHATNSAIKSSLGLGIVRFEEQPEEPTITTYDYEYRTNTEVITAVEVSGGQSDPDNPVTVRFNILGTTYTVSNVYYPDGDSQLAWVRWTTPDTPQDVTITVSVSGPGSAQGTIQCKIVDLDENPPPNPVADDRNDSFSPSAVPSRAEKTSAQWSIWRPWWYAYWVWHGDDESGYWCDHGWWEFDLNRYTASLSATMEITPDAKNPTASGTTMKSGYGINEVVTARVSSSQRSATTALQNAVSYFPEFNYDSFWRLLDRVSISSSSSRLEFQTNEYSTYNRRTHFTPIWYPDGAYTVNTWVLWITSASSRKPP